MKKGTEKNIVVCLFVMVLVVFSFAERESKKIQHLYTTMQLIQKSKVTLYNAAVYVAGESAKGN